MSHGPRVTRPPLNVALDDLVQALERVDDLDGLLQGLAGYALTLALVPDHSPGADNAVQVGSVWAKLGLVAAAVNDNRCRLRTNLSPGTSKETNHG